VSHLTPEFKHDILRQYLPSSRDNSFGALARRYNIKGGKGTIQRWYARWDGTPASLEQRAGAGRHVYSLQHRSVILLLYLFEIAIVLIVRYYAAQNYLPNFVFVPTRGSKALLPL
jgi:hypothetical protein